MGLVHPSTVLPATKLGTAANHRFPNCHPRESDAKAGIMVPFARASRWIPAFGGAYLFGYAVKT
jgi:hypothetical protein